MFEQNYYVWLEQQRKARSGEALRKLAEDHRHAEELFVRTVWWPAIGKLDDLHAEYEVPNARSSSYYLDFAYIRPSYRIDWEIDDFSSHAKNINRRGFEYERDRQNFLTHNGWQVYRFSLDAVRERPLQCQQFVLQVIGKLYGSNDNGLQNGDASRLTLKQREILRIALRLQRPFTPLEVCEGLGIKAQHARKLLHELVMMGLISAQSGKARIRSYALGPKAPTWI
ncbi:DNA-binding response regulator [Cohnella endophytica]|uniref:DNA-binding response regulator n=1 Tax=Cohnella endophytica TaxID=2419778 RepID=A0A494XD95_9BACL|nr:DNA-binding response regulator [Cohnella endophytica]RKP48767.1 DNA-binding response regulator [Cohnella endophytica]